MVDKYIPWRIVADIGSSPMLKYASEYGYKSTDEILENVYVQASDVYYADFQSRILNLYNSVKPKVINSTIECNGRTVFRHVKPKSYSLSSFKNSYGTSYFVRLYCNLRFAEEESQFMENEKSLIIDDVIEISRAADTYKALEQFETFLNKPFDYQGSLGYYSKMKNSGIQYAGPELPFDQQYTSE